MDNKKLISFIKEEARSRAFGIDIHNLILETTLAGSGNNASRHTGQYISLTSLENNPVGKKIKDIRDRHHSSSDEKERSSIARESPLTLSGDHVSHNGTELPHGSYLIPHHSPETYGGNNQKYNVQGSDKPENVKVMHSKFHVYSPNGTHLGTHELPHTSVERASIHTGKYNYEHAFHRLYNHLRKTWRGEGKPSHEHIQNEIEKAANNRNHPLHISQADSSHFAGGLPHPTKQAEAWNRSKETHDDSFHEVKTAVHAMIHSPDFYENWKNGDTLVPSGRETAQPSQLAIRVHGKTPPATSLTSKADAFTFVKNTSKNINKSKPQIKKGLSNSKGYRGVRLLKSHEKKISLKMGSAQLHSGGGADTEIVLRAAANEHFGRHMHDIGYSESSGNITKKSSRELRSSFPKGPKSQFEHVTQVIHHIRHHMDNGNHEDAHALIKHLHENLPSNKTSPGFMHLAYGHATTGRAKFATEEGTATHVAETGKRGSIKPVEEYLRLGAESGQITAGRMRGAKHAGSKGSTWSIESFNSNKYLKKPSTPFNSIPKKRVIVRTKKK